MKSTTFVLAIAFGCLSLITPTQETVVSSAPFTNVGPLPYPVVTPVFKGVFNGRGYELNGTLHEVDVQLKTLHPGVNLSTSGLEEKQLQVLNARKSLVGRGKDALLCFNRSDWWEARYYIIRDGVRELLRRPGSVAIPGRTCIRLWCHNNSPGFSATQSIYACNDNPYRIDPNISYLGTYADAIINKCWRLQFLGSFMTLGQFFDTDGYNVFVRAEPDKC